MQVTSPQIDQYAAAIRRRNAAKPASVRTGVRSLARRAAGDIRKDLPDIDDARLGAVLLRVAAFAHNLHGAQPDAGAGDVGSLLDAAGEWLYHHPAEAVPDCERGARDER